MHKLYIKESPYYRGLLANYGKRIGHGALFLIARDHSTTVNELVAEGLKLAEDGSAGTLDLVQTLGY
jgi:hypothetical protein